VLVDCGRGGWGGAMALTDSCEAGAVIAGVGAVGEAGFSMCWCTGAQQHSPGVGGGV